MIPSPGHRIISRRGRTSAAPALASASPHPDQPSSDPLELAASLLGDLNADLAFLGDANVHLWLSGPAAPPVRSTDDVDAIGDFLGSPADYRLALATAVDRHLRSGALIRAASRH